MGGFLADHEASAVVAGVEPFGRRSGSAAGAIETHARTHFDEGSALWKFYRFFEFDANQSDPLIVLEDADGADGHFIAGFSLADGAPVAGREDYQADHEHGCQHDGGKNDEGFFQR